MELTELIEEMRGKDPDLLGNDTPEEVKGKTPEQLQAIVRVLDAHLRSLHQEDTGELRDLTPSEDMAFRYGLRVREAAIKRIEEHRSITEVFSRRPSSVKAVYANLSKGISDELGALRLTNAEARDAALHKLDERNATAHLDGDQKTEVERLVRRNSEIARRVLVTETDAYRNAWTKMVTRADGVAYLDDEERDALRTWDEYRAASLSNASGGYGVPVERELVAA